MNDQPRPLSALSNAVADNSATEGFILLQEVGWFRPTRASGSVAAQRRRTGSEELAVSSFRPVVLPLDCLGVLGMSFDVARKLLVEIPDRDEDALANHVSLDAREPVLYLVEPRGIRRRAGNPDLVVFYKKGIRQHSLVAADVFADRESLVGRADWRARPAGILKSVQPPIPGLFPDRNGSMADSKN